MGFGNSANQGFERFYDQALLYHLISLFQLRCRISIQKAEE